MKHVIFMLALAATARADLVRILDDPREAVQARVDVIRQATREVDLLYFFARDDRVALAVLAALRDAQRRGVTVRVIIDGTFHRIPVAALAGLNVRVYHPFRLRHPSWLLRRMHEKVIVADGARYVTGGRNLADAYFGLASKNFLDRDVYVDGPSAADAAAYFETLWSSEHVADLRTPAVAQEQAASDADQPRDWSAGARQADVRFLHEPGVTARLHEILGAAQRSIVIESPYFVPTQSVRDILEKKLAEGVEVLVLTNSMHSTDGLLPQAAYLKYRRQLLRAGVKFREYKGPDTLHAKSIVVDGRVALIGSYNIDPRSQYLNTEVICVAEDEEVARELRRSIDAHVANAWAIAPRLSHAASLRLWAARLLLPLLEPQL